MWGVSRELQEESDERFESVVVGHNRGIIQRTYRKLEELFAEEPSERTITLGQLSEMFGTMAKSLDD